MEFNKTSQTNEREFRNENLLKGCCILGASGAAWRAEMGLRRWVFRAAVGQQMVPWQVFPGGHSPPTHGPIDGALFGHVFPENVASEKVNYSNVYE